MRLFNLSRNRNCTEPPATGEPLGSVLASHKCFVLLFWWKLALGITSRTQRNGIIYLNILNFTSMLCLVSGPDPAQATTFIHSLLMQDSSNIMNAVAADQCREMEFTFCRNDKNKEQMVSILDLVWSTRRVRMLSSYIQFWRNWKE